MPTVTLKSSLVDTRWPSGQRVRLSTLKSSQPSRCFVVSLFRVVSRCSTLSLSTKMYKWLASHPEGVVIL